MLSAVQKAKQKLDEATTAARRSGETFRDTGAGALMKSAWGEWMQARAVAGDAFALSLGYGGGQPWWQS